MYQAIVKFIIAVIVLSGFVFVSWYFLTEIIGPINSQKSSATGFACSSEAKICADGSAVGRTRPDCSFADCPEDKIK